MQKQAHQTVLETQALPKDHFSESSNIFKTILSSHNLPPEDKQPQRIAQEGFVVLIAGGETIAQVLTSATFHLLTNKSTALAKLKIELANVMLDPNTRVELSVLEQCLHVSRRNGGAVLTPSLCRQQ